MGKLKVKSGCLAKDEDFKFAKDKSNSSYYVEGKGLGYFHYVGSKKVVEIPHTIQGHPMTSYYKMFRGTNVEKVISTNKNITDTSYMFQDVKVDKLGLYKLLISNVTNMSHMFYNVSINKLDLYSFNTENVTTMKGMFYSSEIKKLNISNFNTKKTINMSSMFHDSDILSLNLSSFDTSNVTNMNSMFKNSKTINIIFSKNFNTSKVFDMNSMFSNSNAKVLDLSSFDTSNTEHMFVMFNNSNATTGYARTQADADKFNKIDGKPKKLIFVTKSKE